MPVDRKPTAAEIELLRDYDEDTYSRFMDPARAEPMVKAGWLEWVPSHEGTKYGITSAGRRAAQED